MISLKKYLDAKPDRLAPVLLSAYRSALAGVGSSSLRACPPVGSRLQGAMYVLLTELASTVTVPQLAETERRVDEELREWGESAARYFQQKAAEFREILLLMTRTAQNLAERDQRYGSRLDAFRSRLESFANLEDLAEIRRSLLAAANELEVCTRDLAADSARSVTALESEVSNYEVRLQEAERLAATDALTGLDNRRKLEVELELRRKLGRPFCVLMIDLNRFKEVNDQHGHAAGDEVLKQFASELRGVIRSTDLAGRWGGDEFMLVLDCSAPKAEAQLGRIREWVFGTYTVLDAGKEFEVQVTAAIGVAEWYPGEAAADTIKRADEAMYADKKKSEQSG